jgi:ketosteroid isomerase-like protein
VNYYEPVQGDQMRHTMPILMLNVSLFLSTSVSAQTEQPQQIIVPPQLSPQYAAVALGHKYDDFYSRKNVAGMASLYAIDGELVSPGGKIIKGREALQAYYRERFASGATGHRIIVLETHGLGDAGYSIATFSVSVPSPGHPSQHHVEQGHIAAVYTHDTTGWHFALVQPSITPTPGG